MYQYPHFQIDFNAMACSYGKLDKLIKAGLTDGWIAFVGRGIEVNYFGYYIFANVNDDYAKPAVKETHTLPCIS